jgi:hypothetical protein
MTMAAKATKRPATVRVIPWEADEWGVAIDHGDGKHDAYPIGGGERPKRKRSEYDQEAACGHQKT